MSHWPNRAMECTHLLLLSGSCCRISPGSSSSSSSSGYGGVCLLHGRYKENFKGECHVHRRVCVPGCPLPREWRGPASMGQQATFGNIVQPTWSRQGQLRQYQTGAGSGCLPAPRRTNVCSYTVLSYTGDNNNSPVNVVEILLLLLLNWWVGRGGAA